MQRPDERCRRSKETMWIVDDAVSGRSSWSADQVPWRVHANVNCEKFFLDSSGVGLEKVESFDGNGNCKLWIPMLLNREGAISNILTCSVFWCFVMILVLYVYRWISWLGCQDIGLRSNLFEGLLLVMLISLAVFSETASLDRTGPVKAVLLEDACLRQTYLPTV